MTTTWTLSFHEEVETDLRSLGTTKAQRTLRAIQKKLKTAPLDYGKPLSGSLAGYHKLRVGDARIVYRVNQDKVEVFVIAVGPRRNSEVYSTASRRTLPVD